MNPNDRMQQVEVQVRHLPGRRLFPYWLTATVGYGSLSGGWHARTRERAEAKAKRIGAKLARDAEPFHGPMRWVVTYPQRDRTDLREAIQ